MTPETHSQLANFIWNICNLLRGPYKRNEYRKVILPLTVLRRFDSLLAPTKERVLEEHSSIKTKPESVIRSLLQKITGRPFYNLSKLDFQTLLDDPNQLAPNLNSYINAFSPNVRAIMERFAFDWTRSALRVPKTEPSLGHLGAMRVVPFFERASLIGGQNRRHQNRHFGFFDLVLACTQIRRKSEVSFMIITLTLSPLNICGDEIHPIKQEDFELLRSLGLVTKRNQTYIVSLHYRDYRLICPVLKTGNGAMTVLWPSFKLPRRRYPVFVYLYAVARYLSTDLSMRAVAAEVRKKFGLATFSHTTLSRTLRKLSAEVDEIAVVGQTSPAPCSCVPLMSRCHWTEEKRRTFAKLLDVLSPVLARSTPDQGNRLAYLFYNRYGRFLL